MSARRLTALLVLFALEGAPALSAEPRAEVPALPDSETPKRPRVEHLTHVVNRTSPWYVSPRPGAAPNGYLAQGTRVQLLSLHGAYARVWTEGGAVFAGYIAVECLRELGPPQDAGH